MLFVTQATYDAEREARAHAEREVLRLTRELDEARADYTRRLEELAARLTGGDDTGAAAAAATASDAGADDEPKELTADDYRRMPAVGRRGVRMRNQLVQEAERRERESAAQKDRDERNNSLSEVERARVADATLNTP